MLRSAATPSPRKFTPMQQTQPEPPTTQTARSGRLILRPKTSQQFT